MNDGFCRLRKDPVAHGLTKVMGFAKPSAKLTFWFRKRCGLIVVPDWVIKVEE